MEIVHRHKTSGGQRRVAARIAAAILLAAVALGVFASGARPARVGAATPVTVRVTIERVIGLFCFDDDEVFGGCGSPPDFFANVSINGGPLAGTGAIDDAADITPNWQFSANVDWDTTPTVPIRIEIRDDDGGLRGDADVADISPLSGNADLVLTLRLGQVPCTFDGSGVIGGTCSLAADVTGAGSDGEALARIIFRVEVLNQMADGDGDGIPDTWEQSGTSLNGQFIDLPAMGADPEQARHLHPPRLDGGPAPIARPLAQPAAEPGPEGRRHPPGGDRLRQRPRRRHQPACGPGAVQHARFLRPPAAHLQSRRPPALRLGRAEPGAGDPRQTNLGALVSIPSLGIENEYAWTEFQQLKDANFTPTGRSPIFHYVIAAVFLQPPGADGVQSRSSGISRNNGGARFTDGASDFIISLGENGGTQQEQAGTLMHELGHNLGLQHGGGDGTNYKPNYLSIMNYLFQLRGLDVAGTAGVLDYSRTALTLLNENALNEANAIGVAGFGTGSRCPQASPSGTFTSQYTTNANAPYDWNCNNMPATNGVIGAANTVWSRSTPTATA